MEKMTLCTNCNNTGENILVYHPDTITPAQIEKALSIRGFFISDCFAVDPEELQFYIIDDRLTLTPALVARVMKLTA